MVGTATVVEMVMAAGMATVAAAKEMLAETQRAGTQIRGWQWRRPGWRWRRKQQQQWRE
jgi:uncharacterized protein YqgV (UPF0045/DUF77 family)